MERGALLGYVIDLREIILALVRLVLSGIFLAFASSSCLCGMLTPKRQFMAKLEVRIGLFLQSDISFPILGIMLSFSIQIITRR